ncbi:MAG: restriction endonuclease subunit S [Rubrivivax sp.]
MKPGQIAAGTTELQALCLRVTSGGTPSRSMPEYFEGGTIPWMKTGEVKQRFVYETEEHITELGLENSSAKLIPANSLVVAMYGDGDTAGNVAINKVPLTTNQACCNFVVDPAKADYRFLYYYLKANYNNLVGLKLGGSQQNLNAATLKRFPVPVVPIGLQRKIAAILSAYDDLIANNQRRIALLEGMAEEIYREWFVRMRFPGADATAAIDAIPAGWTLESLEDLGTFLNGYAFDPSEWFDFGLPIIKIKELNSGVSADTPRKPGERLQERYRFSDGDVIFSWSGSLVVKIWDQGDAWLNQHLFKVTPKASVNRSFLYLSIKFSIPIFESLTTGATMQHIKRKELRFVKVRVPGPELMQSFDQQVAPMLNAALTLKQTNRQLSEIRDALLPRLISGKLKVDHLDIRLPPRMQAEAEAVA